MILLKNKVATIRCIQSIECFAHIMNLLKLFNLWHIAASACAHSGMASLVQENCDELELWTKSRSPELHSCIIKFKIKSQIVDALYHYIR